MIERAEQSIQTPLPLFDHANSSSTSKAKRSLAAEGDLWYRILQMKKGDKSVRAADTALLPSRSMWVACKTRTGVTFEPVKLSRVQCPLTSNGSTDACNYFNLSTNNGLVLLMSARSAHVILLHCVLESVTEGLPARARPRRTCGAHQGLGFRV